MFYLGASANILTYFLVSAFFVVCIYTQDKICLSEFLSSYPYEEKAELTPTQIITDREYSIFYYSEKIKENFFSNFSLDDVLAFFVSPPLAYHSLCPLVKGLRAPPII